MMRNFINNSNPFSAACSLSVKIYVISPKKIMKNGKAAPAPIAAKAPIVIINFYDDVENLNNENTEIFT